jgi:hypothetical protein
MEVLLFGKITFLTPWYPSFYLKASERDPATVGGEGC